MEDFNQMTDTGKFAAITEARAAQEEAEKKLGLLGRYLFGALLIIMSPDEIIARLMKKAEKKGK